MPVDPVVIGLLAIIALLFFGLFLLLRRAALGFKQGYNRGRDQ